MFDVYCDVEDERLKNDVLLYFCDSFELRKIFNNKNV